VAQISLRDYLKGIEEIIDSGQIEDALLHCRHVLQSLPKHVDTYRLMGKAYLEAKRHSEAGDIFQRVLSSVPDDFVAHIGMSIIREDEGNQNAAIWHMERAFEAQPSNRAVQDELRRLYGKREGYELPKVRLTRGALARMYAHGDLYTQAIGELRGALTEDSQRPDLQVLLAEMYLKTNRHAEAIEVCSKIIETLPYCLYANRAMVDILRSSQREVEAQPYLERVDELDPYAVQVDTNTDVDTVPGDSVLIEQLPMETKTIQPMPRAWTGSLQLPAEQGFEKEELPDWLSEDSLPEPEPEIDKKQDPGEEPEESVLRTLYSLDPMPLGQEEAAEPIDPFKKSNTAALVDDQIPDWLRELRPATSTLSLPDDKPAFIADSQAEPVAQFDEEVEEPKFSSLTKKPTEPLATFAEEEPTFPEREFTTPETTREDDENLGWLEGLAAKQGAAEEELLTEPEEREQAQPEWAAAAKPKSDALAWLDELSEDGPATPSATGPIDVPDSEPDEVAPVRNQAFSFEPVKSPEADGLESTTPNWLRDLSAEVKANGDAGGPIAPKPMEEAPDWLNELRPNSAESALEAAQEPAEEETEWQQGASDLTTLDWLEESDKPEGEIEAPAAEEIEPQLESDLSKLDWMEESAKPVKKVEEPTRSEQNVWVPEAHAETATADSQPLATPAVSPRTTARMQTAALAPGKLEEARQALNYGKLSDAADHYGYLLRRRVMLNEIIADLSAALRRYPQDVSLWQTLGDAYMRNNQLKDALDCYTKAEDLL
jgi:tetratricopeptide (TPR) repeat protein